MKRLTKTVCLLAMMVAITLCLAGCAAGTERFSADEPAGFWAGIWHGAISVITMIVHIFNDGVRVYEVDNTGGWYDFGFLFGVICVWGGGSHASCRQAKKKCRKKEDEEWKEVADKVEQKIKRKIRKWAEAEPDEDWDEVEKKAEQKLRDKLRTWAESEKD